MTVTGAIEASSDAQEKVGFTPGIHLCRGNFRSQWFASGGYEPVAEVLFNSPQCGFSSTVHGNEITESDQWAKLELVINTAREIWGD